MYNKSKKNMIFSVISPEIIRRRYTFKINIQFKNELRNQCIFRSSKNKKQFFFAVCIERIGGIRYGTRCQGSNFGTG